MINDPWFSRIFTPPEDVGPFSLWSLIWNEDPDNPILGDPHVLAQLTSEWAEKTCELGTGKGKYEGQIVRRLNILVLRVTWKTIAGGNLILAEEGIVTPAGLTKRGEGLVLPAVKLRNQESFSEAVERVCGRELACIGGKLEPGNKISERPPYERRSTTFGLPTQYIAIEMEFEAINPILSSGLTYNHTVEGVHTRYEWVTNR